MIDGKNATSLSTATKSKQCCSCSVHVLFILLFSGYKQHKLIVRFNFYQNQIEVWAVNTSSLDKATGMSS